MFCIKSEPYFSNGIINFLSKHQLEIHVGKHHQAYVDFCNKNIPGTQFEGKSIEEIIKKSSGPLFNNIAQHYNHSFFWKCLTSEKNEIPTSVIEIFNKNFGSVDNFKQQFVQKASTIFGSGWCYLAKNKDSSVTINQYSNALNPIKDDGIPLLCVDTWEHAWYIDYENRKMEYFNKFWDAVNWKFVENNFREAKLI